MTAEVLGKLPPTFTTAEAKSLGISDRDLYSWRDKGDIDTLARGIYLRPGIAVDHDLVEISVRSADATLCLTSALSRHGLIDDIPGLIDVALPREQRQPRVDGPIRWHRFNSSTFSIDRTELDVGAGRVIGLYGPRRCIVDAFRLRHLYSTEQAILALRTWLTRRGSQPSDLLQIASLFPTTERAIRNALEILL
jgi:Transcriptional regulator, AbiEi antitoxin